MKLLPKVQKRYLSFLFSDNSFKIAKLDSRGVRLSLFFEYDLPAGLIIKGEVKDENQLGEFLLKVKKDAKINEGLIVVGISELKASLHRLTLPSLPLKEMDEAVKFQAESLLPLSYKEEYFDWKLIEEMANGKKKILLSAVPKKIIDGYVTALQKADFSPIAFETTAFSLFRLLPPEAKNLSFAAELEETLSVLILARDSNIEACSVVRQKDLFFETLKKMKDFYFRACEYSALP